MGCKGENLEIVGDYFCGVLCISCKMLLTRFRVLEGGLGRDDNFVHLFYVSELFSYLFS